MQYKIQMMNLIIRPLRKHRRVAHIT